ncbi:MAG: helix-turn-helix domain-containing protein, partial [Prevotella sp.]
VLQDVRVMYVAASASALVCIVTMILTLLNAIRYKKCLDDNYSYTKDISVRWIVKSAFVYILWFFFYSLCFNPTTWFGEAVFDIASIIFWTTLCLLNHSHRVITEMLHKDDVGNEYVAEEEANDNGDAEKRATAEPPMDGEAAEMSSDDEQLRERDAFMATALKYCMENKKLYLNPRLTITDLAHVMRSNKSYISDYVNRRGKTFYDFINEYRISEACRIIETKGVHEKISMSDIALRSGFNSMSSFNRYFSKIKGVSPSSYIRQHEQE